VKVLAVLIVAGVAVAAPKPEEIEFFEKEIRPLLAEKCYACHSSKTKTKFAGLVLDSAQGIKNGSDAGPVIVPGDPANSKLMRAVRGEITPSMPPGGRLSETQMAALARWVGMGAPWPEEAAAAAPAAPQFDLAKRKREHWAWQPVKVVPPPTVDSKWPLEVPDRFLLARLGKAGLSPAPPASRGTWLRRVSFDLTGLPPSPEETAAFEADTAADAYAKQVERLLGSPRFGEHWARHWMDLVRYTESHGSEGDPDVPEAWQYRDYLIRAFNNDVPYDQLIREHLAGDLLPNPRRNERDRINESILGTAHLRMVEHGFQPVDPWEDRVKWTDNQIEVFAKTFQGLTVQCARCHDHKFDAISQRDFYALFGVFGGARPTQAPIDLPEDLDRHKVRLAGIKKEMRERLASEWIRAARALETRIASEEFRIEFDAIACLPSSPLNVWWQMRGKDGAAWRQSWDAMAGKWSEDRRAREKHNQAFRKVWDLSGKDAASWITRGPEVRGPGEFWVQPAGAQAVPGIYPAGVYTNLVSNKHGGVITSPRFKIETDHISLRMLGGGYSYAQLIVENYAVPRGGIYALRAVPKKDEMGWYGWETSFWKGFTAYVEFSTHLDATHRTPDPELASGKQRMPEDGRSWVGAQQVWVHDRKGSPKDEWTPVSPLLDAAPVPRDAAELARRYSDLLVQAARAWAAGAITESQAGLLDYFVRNRILPQESVRELASEYRRLEKEIPVARRAPGVLEEGGADQQLLIRGNHKSPGPVVAKRYLEALGGETYADARTARLKLANAVADPANPLTARVMVNRIWRSLFGAGLVRTVDNFGKLGETPSHPELLDWLADRFVREGWSIKSMIRMLANSQAYRMSSTASAMAVRTDPGNRLLQHMPVRRLQAEAIRDSILWVSGALDPKLYGPSIDTYYVHDTGKTKGDKPKGPLDGAGRRSVYLEIRRNVSNPFLEVFDAPKAATTRGERDVTNVPAQSLALMNGEFVIQQAAKWAAGAAGNDAERMGAIFQRALGRAPTATERDRGETLLASLRAEHTGPEPEKLVWRDFAQAVFNLKEFLYLQ